MYFLLKKLKGKRKLEIKKKFKMNFYSFKLLACRICSFCTRVTFLEANQFVSTCQIHLEKRK